MLIVGSQALGLTVSQPVASKPLQKNHQSSTTITNHQLFVMNHQLVMTMVYQLTGMDPIIKHHEPNHSPTLTIADHVLHDEPVEISERTIAAQVPPGSPHHWFAIPNHGGLRWPWGTAAPSRCSSSPSSGEAWCKAAVEALQSGPPS